MSPLDDALHIENGHGAAETSPKQTKAIEIFAISIVDDKVI